MGTSFILDHVVILVHDLAIARADYAALGFTVVEGGEHENGLTHNALIAFADGGYLELIAFKDGADDDEGSTSDEPSPFERRLLLRKAAGEGLVDFALLPEAIVDAIEEANRRGLAIYGPLPGGRTRPDGRRVSWEVGIPDSIDLPFFCADITPRSLRLPAGDAWGHSNGVTAIAAITVGVSDLDRGASDYEALLGISPQGGSVSSIPGTLSVDFPLSSARITLAAPTDETSPLSHYLARGGKGPFALKLPTSKESMSGALDPARAHGARIELVFG